MSLEALKDASARLDAAKLEVEIVSNLERLISEGGGEISDKLDRRMSDADSALDLARRDYRAALRAVGMDPDALERRLAA